jgi:hypothetical protein
MPQGEEGRCMLPSFIPGDSDLGFPSEQPIRGHEGGSDTHVPPSFAMTEDHLQYHQQPRARRDGDKGEQPGATTPPLFIIFLGILSM